MPNHKQTCEHHLIAELRKVRCGRYELLVQFMGGYIMEGLVVVKVHEHRLKLIQIYFDSCVSSFVINLLKSIGIFLRGLANFYCSWKIWHVGSDMTYIVKTDRPNLD